MARPSAEQWDKLLELVAGDKELLQGEFVAAGGVVRTQQKWDDIAEKVNDVPGAPVTKNGEQWKAAFIGLRSRARRSCRELASYRRGTGGGPDIDVGGLGLSALHEKVINLTGLTAAVGSKCPDPLRMQLQRQNQAEERDHENGADIPNNQAQLFIPNADALLAQFVLYGAGAAANVPHPQPANHVEIHPAPANEGPEVAVPVVADDDQIDQNVIMHVAGAAALAHLPPPMHVEPVLGAAAKLEVVEDLEVFLDDNLVNVSDAYSAKFEALPSFNVPQTHDVIVLSSDDEAEVEPGSAVVKFEPWTEDCIPFLEDIISTTLTLKFLTPVIVGRAKSLHTPPSGTGYTPGCKKRLNVNYKQDGDDSSMDIRTLLRNNTRVMREVALFLHNLKMD